MTSITKQLEKVDTVFKAKNPKRFIQLKTSIINGGTQMIAILSDITRMKVAEKSATKARSKFFAQVAHELRTPLNSIIPILRMILDVYGDVLNDRIKGLLKIILNSAIHLSNVIEDALDLSRLENNNF